MLVKKAASHFSMKKYTQAIAAGSILKHKIEEEIHKRNNNNQSPTEESSLDAVAGTDVGDNQDDVTEERDAQIKNGTSASSTAPALDTISSEVEKMGISGGGVSTKSYKNDYYLSDDSTSGSSAKPK